MSQQIREANFEADIEQVLVKKIKTPDNQIQEERDIEYRSWGEPGGYYIRSSTDYDKEK